MTNTKGFSAARILPFAIYILLLGLNEPLSHLMAAGGLDDHWLYLIRAGLVSLLLAYFWRRYSELGLSVSVPWHTWIVALIAGVVVFALWVLPYPGWAVLGSAGSGFDPTDAHGSIDPVFATFRLAGAALVVPLMEELFWRSYLMRWIDQVDFLAHDPSRVSLRAFVMTAALFAIEHHLWLAGLLAGLAYGWLYMKYRNLWVPVLAHVTTNAMLGIWVLNNKAWQYW